MTPALHGGAPVAAAAPKPPESDFERTCWRLSGFEAHLSPEWVDGYLTGVLAGPRAVPQDEWLPAMTGELFDRVFADPADQRFAMRALAARWRELAVQLDAETLLDEPDGVIRLEPWLLQFDEADHAAFVAEGWGSADEARHKLQSGVAWSQGFRRAMADFAADWREPDADDADAPTFRAALACIDALRATPEQLREHAARFELSAEPTRDELVDEACLAAQELRRWWVRHAPKPSTRRASPQPGRNDPCPCGSGRKFKKCHGA